jgi:hypothetical protein
MSERLPEGRTPRTTFPPVEPSGEVARKNMLLGLGLFALALLIAGGAVAISFIYLHFD